jgi:hypothetical protein
VIVLLPDSWKWIFFQFRPRNNRRRRLEPLPSRTFLIPALLSLPIPSVSSRHSISSSVFRKVSNFLSFLPYSLSSFCLTFKVSFSSDVFFLRSTYVTAFFTSSFPLPSTPFTAIPFFLAQSKLKGMAEGKGNIMVRNGKFIPVTGGGGPKGCEPSRLPHFLDNLLTDGGELSALWTVHTLPQ